ncbi:UDP-N-acetylglucosamine 2-epimerase, partial [Dehalococcoides mccartyi]|nr:UDP-N-acetylglucosamine 2-epimerase [Dehalococcoides mccartyi]
HFLRGVGPEDFVLLIRGCAVLVGNSSAGIREASYLGVPAVNIGDRQLGRLRGPNVIDTDYRADQISSAIKAQIGTAPPEPVQIYGDGSAGEKIAQILATVELKNTKRLTY